MLVEEISNRPRSDFAALGSQDGRRWVAALPAIVEQINEELDLTLDPNVLGLGYNSVVMAAERNGSSLVLKLQWPPESTEDEGDALRAWDGRGTVLVHWSAPARGALLLERLDETCSLSQPPIEEAATEAASLLREMSIGAPAGMESLQLSSRSIQYEVERRGREWHVAVPALWLDAAADMAGDLGRSAGVTLVHADLHYRNVLRGERRRWLAIDPKPIVGDPEVAVAELLRTRVDELEGPSEIRRLLRVIVEVAALDYEKSASWGFVRTIDYWLWSLEKGLTVDPLRCRRVAEALAPIPLV